VVLVVCFLGGWGWWRFFFVVVQGDVCSVRVMGQDGFVGVWCLFVVWCGACGVVGVCGVCGCVFGLGGCLSFLPGLGLGNIHYCRLFRRFWLLRYGGFLHSYLDWGVFGWGWLGWLCCVCVFGVFLGWGGVWLFRTSGCWWLGVDLRCFSLSWNGGVHSIGGGFEGGRPVVLVLLCKDSLGLVFCGF